MLVEQIWTGNAYRNYNYLIACPLTREAVAIDPLAYDLCLKEAQESDLKIVSVINTHEHLDHTGGNDKVINNTGARLYAHENAKKVIKGVDIGLKAGDKIKIGSSLDIEVLDTPGHTMSHICLLVRGEQDALFCGDTLFNAGVGRCDIGGAPKIMFQTFQEQFFPLGDSVRVFPGHDYIENNLGFTLDREAGNKAAFELKEKFTRGLNAESFVSTIGLEREINVFFRLDQDEVRRGVASSLNLNFRDLDSEKTFIGLRRLRDSW